MNDTLNQDPDDMRNRGDKHHSLVGARRARAADDPVWDSELLERAGYASYGLLVNAREVIAARSRAWNSIADGHQGAGVALRAAATFEATDVDGATGYRPWTPLTRSEWD